MSVSKKNLVVFDIDGTLVHSKKLHHTALIETLAEYKFSKLNLDFAGYRHHTDSWIVKEIFRENNREFETEKLTFIDSMMKSFEKKLAEYGLSEISGAKVFVDYLQTSTDWGICFATGSFGELAGIKLNTACIDYDSNQLAHASSFYTREDIVVNAISQAKEHYDTETFETIVSIGDGVWDKKTADNLGLGFVGISDDQGVQSLEQAGSKHIFNNFENVENILSVLDSYQEL